LAPGQHLHLATFPGPATIDRREARATRPGKADRLDNAPGTQRRPPNRPKQISRGGDRASGANHPSETHKKGLRKPLSVLIVAYISNNKRPSLALPFVDVSPLATRNGDSRAERAHSLSFPRLTSPVQPCDGEVAGGLIFRRRPTADDDPPVWVQRQAVRRIAAAKVDGCLAADAEGPREPKEGSSPPFDFSRANPKS
jgi:hypothetical protein